MSTHYNHHIYNWLEKIQHNIENFKKNKNATNEERVEFISHQYHLVMIIHRALTGNVIFVGAKPIDAVPMEEPPIKKTRQSKKKAVVILDGDMEPPIKRARGRPKKVVDGDIEPAIKKTRERKKKQ